MSQSTLEIAVFALAGFYLARVYLHRKSELNH